MGHRIPTSINAPSGSEYVPSRAWSTSGTSGYYSGVDTLPDVAVRMLEMVYVLKREV